MAALDPLFLLFGLIFNFFWFPEFWGYVVFINVPLGLPHNGLFTRTAQGACGIE